MLSITREEANSKPSLLSKMQSMFNKATPSLSVKLKKQTDFTFQLFPNCQEECKILKIVAVNQAMFMKCLEFFLNLITAGVFSIILGLFPQIRLFVFYRIVHPTASTGAFIYGQDKAITYCSYLTKKESPRNLKVFSYRFSRYTFQKERNKYIPFFENPSTMKNSELLKFSSKVEVTQDRIDESNLKNGLNRTDIPDKGLLFLCFNELLSPFYTFQACSYVLWFYEEYLIYCYVILFATVVGYISKMYSERSNFLLLKKHSHLRKDVTVLRMGKRKIIPNDQIIFGDIIILSKGEEVVCDLLITQGNAIVNESMISGDCIPIVKTALANSDRLFIENKENIIYSGSLILSTSNLRCQALRIGFETLRGNYIRSILFPKNHNQISFSRDQLYFILIMGLAALVSFLSTLWTFIQKIEENLIEVKDFVIRCLDFTVISLPPALPLCLSFALAFSMQRLRNKQIYCLDSQNLKICGLIKIICFDKTGTLTENILKYKKISVLRLEHKQFADYEGEQGIASLTAIQRAAVGACHCLKLLNGNIVGDPLDQEMFNSSGWIISEKTEYQLQREGRGAIQEIISKDGKEKIEILKLFTFEHKYERMSTIVRYQDNIYLLTKGTPEKIKKIANPETLPANQEGKDSYDGKLFDLTKEGFRVVALGVKSISPYDIVKTRKHLEKDIIFSGFLVFENKLKNDTTENLKFLLESGIQVNMVTGDNPFTSIKIAKECYVLSNNDQPTPMVDYDEGEIVFYEGDTVNRTTKVAEILEGIYKYQEIVITGSFFGKYIENYQDIIEYSSFRSILMKTKVFARMKAQQKQSLVSLLQNHISDTEQTFVGVCGDGANDCQALKKADMGVSLGDAEASMVSAFNSKTKNVSVIKYILREGRCCLMSYFQAFKFMMMYSFIQVTTTGIIYYQGVIPSDYQFLYWDLFIVLPLSCLIGLTRPADRLYPQHLPQRLFNIQHLISVLGQGCLHFSFLLISIGIMQPQSWYLDPIAYQHKSGTDPSEILSNSFDNTVLFWMSNFQYLSSLISFQINCVHKKPLYTNLCFSSYLVIVISFSIYLVFTTNYKVNDLFEIYPDLVGSDGETILTSMPYYWRIVIFSLIIVNWIVIILFEPYGVKIIIKIIKGIHKIVTQKDKNIEEAEIASVIKTENENI